MLESVEWTRPEALWLLALPAALLLFTRLNSRPSALATGTLEIWKQIAAGRATDGRRSQRRVPLSIWVLVLSLIAGSLAASGPRQALPAQVKSFTCVVDTSPSMYLPLGGATRIERAVAMTADWLAENAGEGDEVLWLRTVKGVRETSLGTNMPASWMAVAEVQGPEPRWSDFDQAGMLWVTDGARVQENVAAVLIASGGEAVSGPVGVTGTTRFDWDGERILRIEAGAQAGIISWSAEDEPRLASAVLEFARVWAHERGFEVEVDAGSVRLTLRAFKGPSQAVTLGRDGWRSYGAATVLPSGPGEVWLESEANDYVRSSAGLVECGLASTEKLGGDVAAFAVSWGELFDRAVLPAVGVVALRERVSAGAELVRTGSRVTEPAEKRSASAGVPLAAWLASMAFLLALLATALGRRR